jgi:hypothetical protein
MSEFFRLSAVLDDETLTIDLVSHEDFSFTLGTRFPEPFPEPVAFRVDTALGGSRLPTLFLPEPVFRVDFIEHLRQSGVGNIDDYQVRIDYPGGRGHIDGYRAVNIIGSVACVDLERSDYEAFEGMYFFDRLVIDGKKTHGAEFFRVAEAHEYIVVARSLAERLDLRRFPDVELIPLDS